MFLILSTITALLECGSIFLQIGYDLQPWQILSLCLAYQIGNLFPQPFQCSKNMLIRLTSVSAGFIIAAYFLKDRLLFQWILYFAGILSLSIPLQSTRASLKTKSSTIKKRIFRIIGFLLSPIMHYFPTLLLLLCCLIVLFTVISLQTNKEKTVKETVSYKYLYKNPYYFIMFCHQLHYFSYTYALIIFVHKLTCLPFPTMFFFACTWLTYLLTEPLVLALYKACSISNTLPHRYLLTIIGGHSVLCIILLLLPNIKSVPLFLFLWIITGFGGGTVFAITESCKRLPTYKKELLDITENAGHLIGTALAVLVLTIFPESMQHLPYLSAFFAVVVILMTTQKHITIHRLSQPKGDKHHENPNHTS